MKFFISNYKESQEGSFQVQKIKNIHYEFFIIFQETELSSPKIK